MAEMREMMAPVKGGVTGPAARDWFDQLMESRPAAVDMVYEAAEIGGVPGWWCRPHAAAERAVVLYLHGGAYMVGSASAYRHFVGQIATRAKVTVFVADYGLAPERPFPAAVEDAEAVYRGLQSLGYGRIALAGDSAGGGLALALQSLVVGASHNDSAQALVGTIAMSPWTDLALSSASMESRAEVDPLSTRDALAETAAIYLGAADPLDPRASPLYAKLSGLPPVRIHVGEDEILLDDSVQYGRRLAAAGGDVEVHVWQGMVHVFPSSFSLLRASRDALDDIARFLKIQLGVGH
ncbi:alpha/beta hydrolase [Sphingomonas sp. LaA6.9]|uniref:alpha/beta hydrolase n=1 Tax=Sphingomonas sp. LaA6.9 TaxID=2919914 RepID=UPI001F502443|nr:alpha/beta hydrolase [Sphingomonas sp. LaA6.9]MCJ8159000.1 alpha/beta hydrolase [Sphingomonas sp. LaA6.9]